MVYRPETFISEYRPARKHGLASSDGWWLNRWPLLGWLETFVKIGAWCFVPLIAVPSASHVPIESFSPAFFVQTLIMGVASILLAAAILDRMFYREVISMIFVFPNTWAHWTVLNAMMFGGRTAVNVPYLRIFCWLMFAGDIVKLIFFAVHDFSIALVAKYVRLSCRARISSKYMDVFESASFCSILYHADTFFVRAGYLLTRSTVRIDVWSNISNRLRIL